MPEIGEGHKEGIWSRITSFLKGGERFPTQAVPIPSVQPEASSVTTQARPLTPREELDMLNQTPVPKGREATRRASELRQEIARKKTRRMNVAAATVAATAIAGGVAVGSGVPQKVGEAAQNLKHHAADVLKSAATGVDNLARDSSNQLAEANRIAEQATRARERRDSIPEQRMASEPSPTVPVWEKQAVDPTPGKSNPRPLASNPQTGGTK